MGTNTYIAWGQVVTLTRTEAPRPVKIIRHVRIDLGKMYETPLEALCIKTQTEGVQRGSLLMEDGNTDHVKDGTGRPVVWVSPSEVVAVFQESIQFFLTRGLLDKRLADYHRADRLRAVLGLLQHDLTQERPIAVLLWRS